MSNEQLAKPKRVGLKDIAKMANISTMSVSNALNGTGRLDPQTRARVIEIAKRMGYRANPLARNLRRQHFGMLAVFASVPAEIAEAVPYTDYFVNIWQGAVSQAMARGYMLLLAPFGTAAEAIDRMPIDGAIVIDPVPEDPILAHLRKGQLATICIGQAPDSQAANGWLDSPHGELAVQMFEHMHAKGAERIGLILGAACYGYSRAVREAYMEWVHAHGQEPLLVEINEPATEQTGYQAALQLLEGDNPPHAIYCALDRLAVGALLAAERLNISVPGQLLLGAGTDGVVSRGASTPISAVDLFPTELGRRAVDRLIEQVENATQRPGEWLQGQLRLRASTDAHSEQGPTSPA